MSTKVSYGSFYKDDKNRTREDSEKDLKKILWRIDSMEIGSSTICCDYSWEPDLTVTITGQMPKGAISIHPSHINYYLLSRLNGPMLNACEIKKVIFNPPATIVFWSDDTKTVVKANNEAFDPEKGLAMAISKKALGNQGNYFNTIKKWVDEYYEEQSMDTSETIAEMMRRLVDIFGIQSPGKEQENGIGEEV